MRITLLTWNVHKCRGAGWRRDPGRILDVIARISPDVAVLQEADMKFGRIRVLFDGDTVREKTGMQILLPEGRDGKALGWRGNLILTRPNISLVSMKTISLPSLEPRGAAIWRLEAGGTVFEVVGMHLGLVGAWRRLQAAAVAAELAARSPVPTIVAGDTNDWGWKSRTMQPLEELLATGCLRPKTFPARRPLLALDRIMAGRGAFLHALATACAGKASDHLPLVSEISLA